MAGNVPERNISITPMCPEPKCGQPYNIVSLDQPADRIYAHFCKATKKLGAVYGDFQPVTDLVRLAELLPAKVA